MTIEMPPKVQTNTRGDLLRDTPATKSIQVTSWPMKRTSEGVGISVRDGWNFGIGLGMALTVALPVIFGVAFFILFMILLVVGGSLEAFLSALQ